MKIKTILASQSQTFNLGDFNSVKIEATLFAEIEDGDDAEACRRELQASVKEAVREAALPFKPYIHISARVLDRVAGMNVVS